MADETTEPQAGEPPQPAEAPAPAEEPTAQVEEPTETAVAPADDAPADDAADDAAPTADSELTLGEAPAPVEPEEPPMPPQSVRGRKDPITGHSIGTGRRKTAIARVRLKEGTGELSINGRSLGEYFTVERDRQDVLAPLRAVEMHASVDVWVRVHGGGTTGQAGAIVLGIARALQVMDPHLHHRLSEGGYLTRDSRMVERKKPGLKKARRSPQFSKR